MKHHVFYGVLLFFFAGTVLLELYGIFWHDYTLSDMILEMPAKFRAAILGFLVYHFLVEYR
jgi:hypothetical protein